MIREEWDLLMVEQMDLYWAEHPPMHLMYRDVHFEPRTKVEPGEDGDLHDLPQEIAAATISAAEFDDLLKSKGYA